MSHKNLNSDVLNFTDSHSFDPLENEIDNTISTVLLVLALIAVVTAMAAALGNSLSIWALLKEKDKNPSTFCVLSLSIWDLVVCLALLLFLLVIKLDATSWVTRFEVLGDVCVKGSTYTTVVISIQRVIAVYLPLQFSSIVTNNRTKVILFVVIPALIVLEAIIFGEKPFGNLLLYYLPPGLLLVGCNLAIVVKLILIGRQRRNLSQSDKNTRKGTMMLLAIALIHILYLSLVLATANTQGAVQQWFQVFFLNIIAFRPFSNVIIYFAFGKSIRQEFNKLFCCGCQYFSTNNEESATAETPLNSNK